MRLHTFRRRLLLVLGVGALVLLCLYIYGLITDHRLLTKLNREQRYADNVLLLAKQVELNYAEQNYSWANILLRGEDLDEYHLHLSNFYDSERQTQKLAAQLSEQLTNNDKLHRLTQHFVNSLHELRKKHRQALRLYNSTVESQNTTEEFLSAITRQPTAMLNNIEESVRQYHSDTVKKLQQRAQRDEIYFVVIFISILTVLTIILLWFIDRSFARPITHAITTAQRVANGNLNERIHIEQSGEFAAFADAFNLMLERLADSQAKLNSLVKELQEEIKRRENVEQSLRKEQQALAAANTELESFSYSISHDLRAPLRSMAGFAGVLHEDYHDRLDEEGMEHLERIRQAAAKMGVLIDKLLELAVSTGWPLVRSASI